MAFSLIDGLQPILCEEGGGVNDEGTCTGRRSGPLSRAGPSQNTAILISCSKTFMTAKNSSTEGSLTVPGGYFDWNRDYTSTSMGWSV